MLTTGIKGTKELKVTDELLAKNVGSGIVSVYATPMMIAGMEGTAAESVSEHLEAGKNNCWYTYECNSCCGNTIRHECTF